MLVLSKHWNRISVSCSSVVLCRFMEGFTVHRYGHFQRTMCLQSTREDKNGLCQRHKCWKQKHQGEMLPRNIFRSTQTKRMKLHYLSFTGAEMTCQFVKRKIENQVKIFQHSERNLQDLFHVIFLFGFIVHVELIQMPLTSLQISFCSHFTVKTYNSAIFFDEAQKKLQMQNEKNLKLNYHCWTLN